MTGEKRKPSEYGVRREGDSPTRPETRVRMSPMPAGANPHGRMAAVEGTVAHVQARARFLLDGGVDPDGLKLQPEISQIMRDLLADGYQP